MNDYGCKRRSSAAGPALRAPEYALVAGFLNLHAVAVEVNSAPAKAKDFSNPQASYGRKHSDRSFGFILERSFLSSSIERDLRGRLSVRSGISTPNTGLSGTYRQAFAVPRTLLSRCRI